MNGPPAAGGDLAHLPGEAARKPREQQRRGERRGEGSARDEGEGEGEGELEEGGEEELDDGRGEVVEGAVLSAVVVSEFLFEPRLDGRREGDER